jgi:ADP-ribose pyrophosphatase YjhB (NUDIX family)
VTARDQRLLHLLDGLTPASVVEVQWRRRLTIASHLGAVELPDDLVVAVRCLVLVDDRLLMCTNVRGLTHPWPGGRRERGESYVDTAVREVHEETGWHLERNSVVPVGFLHLFNEGAPLDPYPHPDSLQLVVRAAANERSADDWTDTEGFELSSALVPLGEAGDAVSAEEPMALPFINALANGAA